MLAEVPRVSRPLKAVQASKKVQCLYSALRLVAWNLCRLQRKIIVFAALQFVAGEDVYEVKQEKRGISSFLLAV